MNADELPIPFTLWKESGVTEHLGGREATQHLINSCSLVPGQYVLDAGCGTGDTVTYLADKYQVTAIGLDLMAQAVRTTLLRQETTGLAQRVLPVQADVAYLPFAAGSFDCVLVESLLVFCSVPQVTGELWRVLGNEGCLGVNELTLLAPAAGHLQTLLARLGIQAYEAQDWYALLAEAGFRDIRVSVHPIELRTQMSNHLHQQGLRAYLASAWRALTNPAVRQAFLNREMLIAYRHFRRDIGYGLYVGKKG